MLENINAILASLAEVFVDSSASTFLWGEEEVPECLKEKNKMTVI